MVQQSSVEAKERVLTAAEQLFAEHGYQQVTLRDIAHQLGIKHASLYYHFPNGKEELFFAVTERRMQRYRDGLEQAINIDVGNWQSKLRAAALWLLSQPHMHLGRMMQSEMPSISPEAAEQLRIIVFDSLLRPLESIFHEALLHQPAKSQRSATIAGMFLSLIEGVDNLPPNYVQSSQEQLVDFVLDLFIHGLV